MKRVLISGGGIAGLTLAHFMATNRWEVTVAEKAPMVRPEGYMMFFYGNGWKVAERMGVLDQIREIRYPIESFKYVDASGKPYVSVPIHRVIKGFGGEYTCIRRSDLERILLEKVRKDPVQIQYNTSIVALEESDRAVNVKFQNGAEGTFDVVVGADGVHSRVRELVFGEENNFSRFLGFAVATFQLPLNEDVRNSITVYQEPNREATLYPISDKAMQAILVFRYLEKNRIPLKDAKNVLLNVYKGSRWILQDAIQNVSAEEIALFDVLKQIRLPHWSNGRVGLVGDACACLTLTAAQGSSMAMLESWMLAEEFQKNNTPEEAFRRYESKLQSDIEKRQAQAVGFAKTLVPSSGSQIRMRRWLMQIGWSPLFAHQTANIFKGKIYKL